MPTIRGTESASSASAEKRKSTKVVQNTAVLLAGRISAALLGGASSIAIARCLGTEQLGKFSSLYAYVSLFGWLATIGIEPVLTRESARWRERSGSIIATGVALCGIFAMVAAVFVIWLAPYTGYRGQMQMLVVLAAIELLLLGPLRLGGVIFQVDLKQWYGTGINLARQGLWLLIILFLARVKGSLTSFVLGRLTAAAVETILIVVMSRGFLKPPRRIVVDEFKVYLRASLPIGLSSLLANVYLRIDQVMLHNLTSDKIVGFYAASVKVSELFEMLPAALLSSLFPILAVATSDPIRMAGYTDRIFRYLMFTAGLLCIVICTESDLIVRTLYGQQFGPSAQLLSILIWSEFAIFFGSAMVNLLLVQNLQNFLIFPTIVGAIANVLLNLIWIPRYAAVGAAWATLVSYSVAWGGVLLGFADTRDMVAKGLRKGVPVVLLSAFAVLVASRLRVPSVLRVVSAFGIYAVGIGLIGTIKSSDFLFLLSILSRTGQKDA